MECDEHDKLLQGIYALTKDVDSDVIIPMFLTIASGAAAQDGVNRDYFTRFAMQTIADAYEMFTRDENKAVH